MTFVLLLNNMKSIKSDQLNLSFFIILFVKVKIKFNNGITSNLSGYFILYKTILHPSLFNSTNHGFSSSGI